MDRPHLSRLYGRYRHMVKQRARTLGKRSDDFASPARQQIVLEHQEDETVLLRNPLPRSPYLSERSRSGRRKSRPRHKLAHPNVCKARTLFPWSRPLPLRIPPEPRRAHHRP
jgi:hypothetical protein